MNAVLIIVFVAILLFGLVVFIGAPYLPTLTPQIKTALDLLDLKPGETLLELGCGDGRVLRAAAINGCKAVGYEINPILVLVARVLCWPYRKQVSIKWGNYWRQEWPKTEGIFVFLRSKYMEQLNNKIVHLPYRPIKLVSVGFKIKNRQTQKVANGVYLYKYQ